MSLGARYLQQRGEARNGNEIQIYPQFASPAQPANLWQDTWRHSQQKPPFGSGLLAAFGVCFDYVSLSVTPASISKLSDIDDKSLRLAKWKENRVKRRKFLFHFPNFLITVDAKALFTLLFSRSSSCEHTHFAPEAQRESVGGKKEKQTSEDESFTWGKSV